MTRFMVCHQLNLFLALQHAAPLRSHADLIFGVLKIAHGDNALVRPRGQQRCLVDHVCQICTRVHRHTLGQAFQINIRTQWNLFSVYLQDFLSSQRVRQIHLHLTVETTRTQQRLVKNINSVGCSNDDDTLIALKAIHLNQHLV